MLLVRGAVLTAFLYATTIGAMAQQVASNSASSSRGGYNSTSQNAIAQDVVRPFGEYQYLPQKGIYRDVTLGDVAEDFNSVGSWLKGGVNSLNRLAMWSTNGDGGDLTWNINAGLRGFTLPGMSAMWGSAYNGTQPGYLTVRAGPLLLDNFVVGYGAIYDDINGRFPGIETLPPDDRWAQIVWMSARVSMSITDSFGLSLQPYIYWLPSQGKVGWTIPGPMAGLMLPQIGSTSLLQVAWAKEIGNWKFALFDQFSPCIALYNIWNVMLMTNPYIGDMSPIDRVGRYAVGYGAADLTNYDPLTNSRFGTGDFNNTGLLGYYNMAGFRAYGTHGYRTQSMYYFNRNDFWNKNFHAILSTINGGAYIRNGDNSFSTYAGYDFISAEPYDVFLNSAMVGVMKSIPRLTMYAQAGYFWFSGEGDGQKGWLGTVGLRNQLGQRTYQSVEAGRRVFKPANTLPGIEDYAQYQFMHQLTLRTSLTAYAGISERHVQDNFEQDYVIKYAGVLMSTALSQRLQSFASAGWEYIESETADLTFDKWLYRFGLLYSLTQNIQSQCYYQYDDVHGSLDYTEHYIYLGVSKRF